MVKSARTLIVSAVALCVCASSAHAAPITLNYDFTATGFLVGAPVDPITGSFSVTFDNATDLTDVTSGISLTGLNINLGSVPAFTYFAFFDILEIGGLASGVTVIDTFTTVDFLLAIDGASTPTPTSDFFAYNQIGSPFFTETVTLTPSEPTPVPEPTTVALLGLGLAGMGARRWRQRKRV